MNDEQIKQRINYLVEHGGIFDDPFAALHRKVNLALTLAGVAVGFHALEVLARWM